jgi:D-alanyl-D-alanine carboxypeptidase
MEWIAVTGTAWKRGVVVVAVIAASGCGAGVAQPPERTRLHPTVSASASPRPSIDPPPATSSAVESPIPSPTVVETSAPDPMFHARISDIDAARAATMHTSWHPGCPVELADLRVLHLSYWGFDDHAHRGELIVAASQAEPVVSVFRQLFVARFPVHLIEPVDAFGGDDDRSMAADNTSGFNCRAATGNPDVFSQHSYGLAIDLNPFENPYVTSSGTVLPPEAKRFADRSIEAQGVIQPGSVAVRAFESIGWHWGGAWTGTRDYQHFSLTGG